VSTPAFEKDQNRGHKMSNGWIFYTREGDEYRNFTVGEDNEDAAKLAVQTQFPNINFLDFVTKQRADANLINFLGLEGGKIMEWRSVERKDKVEPRGTDIDSDYDPLRGK
jgi:hypothetical protein